MFLTQIEILAVQGDTRLLDYHKEYIDPTYSSNTDLANIPMPLAANDIASQLQALNLPSAVYYGLLAFSTALGVPVGNVVDVVIGLGLAAIIVANWDSISKVWSQIVSIFVNAYGSYVMDAFYYLQGLVGYYDVTVKGNTVTINGEKYVCNVKAEEITLSMSRNKHTYYPAYRTQNAVWVCPRDIPRQAALEILKLNNEYFGVFFSRI